MNGIYDDDYEDDTPGWYDESIECEECGNVFWTWYDYHHHDCPQ